MKMNKVLVKLYVPILEQQYDVWIPLNKNVYNIIHLLVKAINEFSDGYYNPTKMPILYNKVTSLPYDLNINIKEANICNGTEIILI